MPGAQCTRSLVCALVLEYAHEYSQRRHRRTSGNSPRNGFTAYIALSLGTGLSCPHRPRDNLAGLASASGGQDHTPSPSASAPLA